MATRTEAREILHGVIAPRRPTRRVRHSVNQKRSAIATYKLERGCIDCGYNRHPRALDFDHRHRGAKHLNISRMAYGGSTLDEILDELEKCDVRCANCHRIKTEQQGL